MSKRQFVEFITHSAGNDGVSKIVLVLTSLPQDRTNAFQFDLGKLSIQIGKLVNPVDKCAIYGIVSRRKLQN